MQITFYGVRGSTPTPGKNTLLFGGNTSCVYVRLCSGEDVILDAGTGIIALGDILVQQHHPLTILLTHNHWDHIQGFPYFRPIYQPKRPICIVPGAVDFPDKAMILKQMSGSTHPVKYHSLPANISLDENLALRPSFSLPGFNVETLSLNHPDGGTAYCLYAEGKKVAYVTDNELLPPDNPKTSWQQWLDFIRDADVLIHDAQYTDADLPLKHGWGHSTFKQVAQLAFEANVKQLFIISHDPAKSDNALLIDEQKICADYQGRLEIRCAREGDSITLAKG